MTQSYVTDALIYSALASVDLQSNYFTDYNTPKNTEINNLREEFISKRRLVLANFRGHWSYKKITLPSIPTLEKGWYYFPNDWIEWYNPVPLGSGEDDSGRPTVHFFNNDVVYLFDREDLVTFPPEIVNLVKLEFLWSLTPRAVVNPLKRDDIFFKLKEARNMAAMKCNIDRQSKQRMPGGIRLI